MALSAHDTRRTRLLTALCALALALGPGACAAWAQDGAADGAAAAQPVAAQTPAADALAQQVAAATATATQQAPQNVAIPVQVLSPGDSGAITQVNTVSAGADAANTVQAAPPPTDQASPPATGAAAPPSADATPAPAATTQQTATATAQVTQTAPANVYIPVSVLSPGDHGPVTQINSAGAQATATNAAQPGTAQPAQVPPPAQSAGADAGAAQQAPANVSAPVTVGGVDVGEHPATTPWIWTWVWQLDCGASAAPPQVAALAPIISQVTGGAWEWHWTWTCGPATGATADAPGASGPQGQAPGATQEPALSPAGVQPAAATPGAAPTAPSAASGVAQQTAAGITPSGARNVAVAPSALMGLGIAAGLLFIPADITPSAVISPTTTAHSAPARTNGQAPPARVPDPRPAPPAPPVLAAGASGGSGGAPLSIGLAALIGAFLLTVPRFGTRARTQLVHRSAQAVPDAKDRPG